MNGQRQCSISRSRTIDRHTNCRDAYLMSTFQLLTRTFLHLLIIGRLCFEDGASYEKHMRHIACACKMAVSPGTETASARSCTLVSQFHLWHTQNRVHQSIPPTASMTNSMWISPNLLLNNVYRLTHSYAEVWLGFRNSVTLLPMFIMRLTIVAKFCLLGWSCSLWSS